MGDPSGRFLKCPIQPVRNRRIESLLFGMDDMRGKERTLAFFKQILLWNPWTFKCTGNDAANSTTLWSRNGARVSREFAIDARLDGQKSSTNQVLISVYMARSRKSTSATSCAWVRKERQGSISSTSACRSARTSSLFQPG